MAWAKRKHAVCGLATESGQLVSPPGTTPGIWPYCPVLAPWERLVCPRGTSAFPPDGTFGWTLYHPKVPSGGKGEGVTWPWPGRVALYAVSDGGGGASF